MTTDLVSESSYIDTLPEPDRYYPVLVTTSSTYTVWVEGDSPKVALRDLDWEMAAGLIEGESPEDSDITWALPSGWNMPEESHGPLECCAECGDVQAYIDGYISHKGSCSQFTHGVSLDGVWPEDIAPAREMLGWVPRCYCGWPFPDRRPPGSLAPSRLPDGMAPMEKEEAAELCRQHIVGRYHSRNIPLGILTERRPERT